MITRHTTLNNYNQRSYSLVNIQREKDAYSNISHTKRKTAQADELAQQTNALFSTALMMSSPGPM